VDGTQIGQVEAVEKWMGRPVKLDQGTKARTYTGDRKSIEKQIFYHKSYLL
jgi:hypothetical protein